MPGALLSVSGLVTHLGSPVRPVKAVDGVDFEIHEGETFALLGESGCGKSITALSLMRLLPASGRIVSGSIRFDAQELLGLSEARMRAVRGGGMTMIFQEPMTSLNPVLSIGRQIAEALRAHQGETGAAASAHVQELLQAVRMPDPAKRAGEYPHQLSGGMKQRVMIAMALAGRPKLLIADEPTTALDVTVQSQVLDLIRQLQRQRGMAVLLITHDLGVVAEMADRLVVMYAGEIVECAGRKQFFRDPRHPYSRALLDSLPGLGNRKQPLRAIGGFVPSLQDEFIGCRFFPRCERALSVCERQAPVWFTEAGHRVLCHLYTDEAERPAAGTPGAATATPVESEAGTGPPLLEVRRLEVHFPIQAGLLKRTVGHVRAVDGVDLDIPAARTLALVGESGCGKTTVGKSILQLITPTEGSVRFDGVRLNTLPRSQLRRRRAELQIIFQDPYSSMNPRMLVGDIIAEGISALIPDETRQRRRQRIENLLNEVGLPADSAQRYPHEFSGGQRQRICIARALAVEPKLIICDEPTSALDVSVQAQILNLLQALQQQLSISYLFITHNMSVVSYLADDIAVMYLGRIVEQGPVNEVLLRPRHPYTEALLSAVPVLDGDAGREVIRLQGDAPSPSSPPPGCYFHPRCPRRFEACGERYPARTEIGDGHHVHCHLHADSTSACD